MINLDYAAAPNGLKSHICPRKPRWTPIHPDAPERVGLIRAEIPGDQFQRQEARDRRSRTGRGLGRRAGARLRARRGAFMSCRQTGSGLPAVRHPARAQGHDKDMME